MDLVGFLKLLVQYIPTTSKLKRMYAMNRPSPFLVSGNRAFAIIGICVCIIGLQAFNYGYGMQKTGSIGIKQYEKMSDKAINLSSKEESKNYNHAQKMVRAGSVIKSISLFIAVIGLFIAFKPQLLYYELKRFGLIKEITPPY